MEKKYLSIGIIVLGIVVAFGVLLTQGGKVIGADGFGFDKNDVCRIDSCPDAVKGVCEMKKDRGAVMANINDIRSDCDLGRSVTFDEIKSLCANFGPEGAVQNVCTPEQCVEVSPEQIHSGACKDFSFIDRENLPQCCGFEGPQGGINCGADAEWVVGITVFPVCYIPGS